MDSIRKYNIKRLEFQIRTNEESIAFSVQTISNFKKGTINDRNFIESQTIKLNLKIQKLEDDNLKLDKEIIDIKNGIFDIQYEEIRKNAEQNYEKKYISHKEKIEKKHLDKKNAVIESKNNYKLKRTLEKASENEMNNGLKYFYKVSDSIPNYITTKLKNMPNNKGYIWRGMYLYGYKDAEKGQPVSMFETSGNVLTIHEWSQYEYRVYEKIGEAKKVLKSCKPRTILKQQRM